ncbi:MAG: hypothetical protein Q4G51_16010 [Dermatophilus congolensis]|nr:hypothetical protein [Dermatophilus congolensis]
MIVSAALVPCAPVMLPRYRSLSDPGAPWREASIAALVKALRIAEAGPGATELVVLGSVSTGAVTTTHAYRSAPLSLRVARMIVEGAIVAGAYDPSVMPVEEVVIAEDATREEAETLGLVVSNLPIAQGSSEEGRTVLLVVADGSACRDLRAPGHLDERAQTFDSAWMSAVESGSPQGLLDIDADLATELWCSGRAPLQALGAATRDRVVSAEVLASGDPFGVAYSVVVWTCG